MAEPFFTAHWCLADGILTVENLPVGMLVIDDAKRKAAVLIDDYADYERTSSGQTSDLSSNQL